MSIVTTVGITGNVLSNDYLLQTALSVGLQVDSFVKGTCNHKFELPEIAKDILQNGQWVTIINSDGEPDLNLVYNFSTPLSSNIFGRFLLSLSNDPSINELVILFFDLGTNEIYKHEHSLPDIERILCTYYQSGGPACTVIHRFTKFGT